MLYPVITVPDNLNGNVASFSPWRRTEDEAAVRPPAPFSVGTKRISHNNQVFRKVSRVRWQLIVV